MSRWSHSLWCEGKRIDRTTSLLIAERVARELSGDGGWAGREAGSPYKNKTIYVREGQRKVISKFQKGVKR